MRKEKTLMPDDTTIAFYRYQYPDRTKHPAAVRKFKEEVRRVAKVSQAAYQAVISDHDLMKTIILKRHVLPFAGIILQLSQEYHQRQQTGELAMARFARAALSLLPNETTLSAVMELLAPFAFKEDDVRDALRFMVVHQKIGCICADGSIIQQHGWAREASPFHGRHYE